jgi:hypothetical protein
MNYWSILHIREELPSGAIPRQC